MKDWTIARPMRFAVSGVAVAVMALFLVLQNTVQGLSLSLNLAVTVLFTAVYALSAFLMASRRDCESFSLFTFALLAMAALVYMRVCLLDYRSADYVTFLSRWVSAMRGMSVRQALVTPIGDYNVPYLYLLLLISRIPASDLLLIKAVSCFFDILLCLAVFRIVSRLTESPTVRVISFVVTAAVPTVLLNGGMWAQCDSVYAFFCLMAVDYLLQKRGRPAMIYFGLGFAFKLQTVFLAPIVLAALFTDRMKARHLVWFPAVNLLAVLPALIAGRSFSDTFMIYVRQTSTYTALTMNLPTVFTFFPKADPTVFSAVGVMMGGLAALTVLFVAFRKRTALQKSDEAFLLLTLICSLAVPFFLPHMHDRYYFVADVLCVAAVAVRPKRLAAACVIVFSSFVTYIYYLFGVTMLNYLYLALALVAVLAWLGRDLLLLCDREVRDGTSE